jgi:hypothetical protein
MNLVATRRMSRIHKAHNSINNCHQMCVAACFVLLVQGVLLCARRMRAHEVAACEANDATVIDQCTQRYTVTTVLGIFMAIALVCAPFKLTGISASC